MCPWSFCERFEEEWNKAFNGQKNTTGNKLTQQVPKREEFCKLKSAARNNAGSWLIAQDAGKWDLGVSKKSKLGLRDKARKKEGSKRFMNVQEQTVNTRRRRFNCRVLSHGTLRKIFSQKLVSCWVGSELALDWRRNPKPH